LIFSSYKLFRALLSQLVISYLIEILLVVLEWNNQWEWEGNGNKARLNLGSGMGMGMNHCEWEGMGWKKTFPHTSNDSVIDRVHVVYQINVEQYHKCLPTLRPSQPTWVASLALGCYQLHSTPIISER